MAFLLLKQHALYQALKAFGQVPKSLFILQVIDDPVLRQAIEKQLDRIEHVHRFTRAVSVGNPREFLQAEKEDQEMAEACKRLIKNCIICWNYLIVPESSFEPTHSHLCRIACVSIMPNRILPKRHHRNPAQPSHITTCPRRAVRFTCCDFVGEMSRHLEIAPDNGEM